MVKAMAMKPDGTAVIVLGISDANVTRLRAGDLIYFDPTVLKIAPGTTISGISLFFGRDEGELGRTLRTMIGPQTTVFTVPQGDPRPQ